LVLALLQGLGVLLAVCGATLWSGTWLSEGGVRAFVFITLVVGNLALIFSNRATRGSLWDTLTAPNRVLWLVTGITLLLLALSVYVPWLARLFQFDALVWDDALLAAALGAISVLWFEVLKRNVRAPDAPARR
jgi:Ca2+-transporting ATPase